MNGIISLRIHQILPGVKVLGPYERFGIWTQGCERCCPGCMTPESRPLDGGIEYPISEIADRILRHPECEGLTISGGEPFLQAPALCSLIDRIHAERDLGVITYTGYILEELRSESAPKDSDKLLERTDLLIDGPFIQDLNDDGSLRGSSNQRVFPLSERYRNFLDMYGVPGQRIAESRLTKDGFCIIGVISKSLAKLQNIGDGS